jgi:dienelactone hydrolase
VPALLAESRAVALADAQAVRRAADVLSARADVDPHRLGYLGWSAGAKTGALVAAFDGRFRALALLSGGAQPVSAFVAAAPAPFRKAVLRVLTSIDPLTAIRKAKPGTILLEDGRRDAIVPRAALDNFVRAAPKGTVVRWYPAGHALDSAAFRDAEHWLAHRLAK